MATTLTQISNVFNLMCQADTRIFNYHYGWRSDINKNIYNNFDEKVTKGRQFPAVHQDKPDGITPNEEAGYLGTDETVQILLYFDTLQDYFNDGSTNILNLIEQEDALKTIANDYMANLVEVIGVNKYNIGTITDIKYVQRSNQHNQKLITWEVSFNFKHKIPCTPVQYQIDLDLLPDTIEETDIERGASVVDACLALIANLSEEQMNECLLPTYDFRDPVVRINTTVQQQSDMTNWLCTPTGCFTIFKGLDEYVKIMNDPSVSFDIGDTFSVSAWVNIPYLQSMGIAGSFNSTTSKGWYFGINPAGNLRLVLANSGTTSGVLVEAPFPVGYIGSWVLVTASTNGNGLASGIEITVDTNVLSTTVVSDTLGGNSFDAGLNINFGKIGNIWFYVGSMANVGIYNTVLSAAYISDINNLMRNNTVPYTIPGVVSHYLMDTLNPIDEVSSNDGTSFNQDASNIICN